MNTDPLPKIGFWSETHDPASFRNRSSDVPPNIVRGVIDHLRNGTVSASYKGMAKCRICDKPLGSKDLTDGVFVWPQDTDHYIVAHRVWTPGHMALADHLDGPIQAPRPQSPSYGLATAGDPTSVIAKAYPQAGYSLARKIVEVAHDLDANPYDLANLIGFESAYSFRSDVKNPSSGATGLIQFMPNTARKLGTSLDKLASLSPVQQMEWVKAYLLRVKQGQWGDKKPGDFSNLQKLAMAVFYPWAREWDANVSFTAMGHSRVPEWNPGIDTPGDYLKKLLRNAKLQGAPAVAPKAEPGIMERVSEAWESWWEPTGRASPVPVPVPVPVSTPVPTRAIIPRTQQRAAAVGSWATTPGLRLQLKSSDGTTYGPGNVPAGPYSLEFDHQGKWVPIHNVSIEAGKRYQASQDRRQLIWRRAR